MLRRTTRLTRGLGLVTRPRYATVRLYSDSTSYGQDSQSETRSYQPRTYDPALTVHFAGLPVTATREKLTEALQAAGVAGVSRINVPTSSLTHGSRGFAFVTFDSVESANAAKNTSVSFEGNALRASSSRTREESQKLKIYIGDLDFNLKDTDLRSALEQAFGPVEYASVASHRGLSKGFGFATFKNSEDAEKARAVGRLMIDGKQARVESVRDREPRPRDGGRYGDRSEGSSDRGYGSERGYNSRGGDRSYGSDRGYGSDRSSDRGYGSERGYNSRGGDRYGSRGSDSGSSY